MNLTKDVAGMTPTKAVFESTSSDLLTARLRVGFLPVHVCRWQANDTGLVGGEKQTISNWDQLALTSAKPLTGGMDIRQMDQFTRSILEVIVKFTR